MIEDMKHMTLLQTIASELEAAVVNFNQQFNGEDDRNKVLAMLTQQNDVLAEMVHRHRRGIDFVAGREVKPEVQSLESVLVGVGAGAMS